MSELTAIEWTDSTFNPWIGCTKVGPGCDHCYAEALMDVRHKRVEWGAGKPRVRTSADNWKAPLSWNRFPFYQCLDCGARFAPLRRGEGFITCPSCSKHGGRKAYDEEDASRVKEIRRRVFCASLADVFDNEVDHAWRTDLWALIEATPNLDWLVLTKRIGNAGSFFPAKWLTKLPSNIWIGATVVNQDEADRDIPKLLQIPAHVRFLSCEPLLGPIHLASKGWLHRTPQSAIHEGRAAPTLDWVIAGGESGAHARPMHPDWARSLRDQCREARVPFLFKQWGEYAPFNFDKPQKQHFDLFVYPNGMTDIPDFRAPHEETGETAIARLGKKAAGRELDGREWNGFPEAA